MSSRAKELVYAHYFSYTIAVHGLKCYIFHIKIIHFMGIWLSISDTIVTVVTKLI